MTAIVAALAGATMPPALATGPPPRARVVLIAVPDLRWSDLAAMPRLRAFASGASVGELSVRATGPATGCADGIATLSAGNRASAGHGCTLSPERWSAARSRASHNRFGAHIGALGAALRAAHMTTAAVGAMAAPIIADEHGDAGLVAADVAQAVKAADVVAAVDAGLYVMPPSGRAAAARATDRALDAQLAQAPATAVVIVAGISDGARADPHLHPILVSGPGWPHRQLRSASTGRAPFVQLIDLAPTVLAAVHLRVPSVMAGRPARATGGQVASAAHYVDDDRHARRARAVGGDTVRGLAIAVLVLVGAALVSAWRRRAAVVVRAAAGAVVAVPATTFLIQLAPWWRWSTTAYAGVLAAAGAAGGAVLIVLARRGAAAVVLAGGAITAAVLVADQLAGSPLQLSAPLGDNPLVAGRFHGLGNVAFGLMAAALVLVAAVGAGWLRRRISSRAAVAAAVATMALAVVVDAAPPLGDDFGGLLALVPAAAVLVVVVAGKSVSVRRVAAFVVVAVAIAVVVAVADYSRSAADQTHIGRFVGQVLHGGAGRVIRRKADASLGSFGNSVATWLVGGCAGVAVALRRSLWHRFASVPGLSAGVIASVVLAVLGSAVNDSGVAVAAAVLLIVVPVVAASGVLAGNVPTGGDRRRAHNRDGDDDDADPQR